MHKLLIVFAALGLGVALCGCADFKAPVCPPKALFYTHYKAPLMTDYKGDDLGTRKGSSSSRYFRIPLRFDPDIAWSDAAIQRAAKNGKITTVKGADYEYLNVLWIYKEFTVHAYGD